jgi:molybdopterin converting factor small subunit
MKVDVEYSAQARIRAGCVSESFEMSEGVPLAGLLEAIAERHGDPMRELLYGAGGGISGAILLFLGDGQVSADRPDALRDGDRITVMSPISGG